MCYCYRKLGNLSIFNVFLGGRGRPWEAVRGRAPLIGLEICVRESQIYWSQWEEHGLSRPLTASHFCHVICLSQSGEHGLSRTRPLRSVRPWESDRPLTHSGRCSPIPGQSHLYRPREYDPRARLTDFTAKRIASPGVRSVCVRGRSDSQICEAVGVRPRPLTTKSCDLSESPKWEAVLGLPRPHRSAVRVRSERPCGRPIGLSRTPGDAVRSSGQSHLYRPKQCV